MSRRDLALRYGELLLSLIRRAKKDEVWALCDRFERLMANLPPVPRPLVWDGDYA